VDAGSFIPFIISTPNRVLLLLLLLLLFLSTWCRIARRQTVPQTPSRFLSLSPFSPNGTPLPHVVGLSIGANQAHRFVAQILTWFCFIEFAARLYVWFERGDSTNSVISFMASSLLSLSLSLALSLFLQTCCNLLMLLV
jgi:hypothetical protein